MITEINPSKQTGSSLRILIVENEAEVRLGLLQDFQAWGYQAIAAQGEQQALIDDAIQKAKESRCHIATVDMHLLDDYDQKDRSGLEIIRLLLPTRSIVLTGSKNYQAVLEALKMGAETYISKSEGPARLRQAIDALGANISATRRGINISWPAGISPSTIRNVFPDGDQFPEDEPTDLLARLFPNAKELWLYILRDINTEAGLITRPSSFIFKVREDERQPVIVKVARADRIKEEIEKYREFVDGKLVGNFCPELQNSLSLWDLGGVIYRFIGKEEDIFIMSDYYDQETAKDTITCLDQFFQVSWSKHYIAKKIVRNESIFNIYSKVWRGTRWLDDLQTKASEREVINFLNTWSGWKSLGTPDPIEWVIKRVEQDKAGNFPDILIAVTHGDFHADNVIIDARNHYAWPIDFERTGEGHAFQDFTELETDIILRLSGLEAKDFEIFYQLCLFVTQSREVEINDKIHFMDIRLDKALKVIAGLRQNAVSMTSIRDGRQYLWGLLLNSLFRTSLLLKADEIGYHTQRSLMLASIICYRLDHWGAQWPPQRWPKPKPIKPFSDPHAKGIPKPVLLDLIKLLEHFHEFEQNGSLRAVFVTEELKPFQSHLRSASTVADRVNQTIDYLAGKRLDDGRSALIFFLQILADNHPAPDSRGPDLHKLIEQL